MSGPHGPGQGAVAWLTGQSLVFGAMAALLGIVANALFLEAYGSGWLPATYIAIGAAGIVVSGAVARTAQQFDLLGIALSVLGAAAVGLGASWLVAAGGDAAWVSVPLLVLFPILIQLGFVFIGGQAGRILDIAGIKASFPRIMAGFPVGAVIGGLLGAELVSRLGRAEDLLLATALAQAAFAGLVWATGRKFRSELRLPDPGPGSAGSRPMADDRTGRPSLRRLFATRFVALILAYQVLSALGSQLADFLVFDRAAAQYPDAADLARFLAGYTAVMNIVSIGFLVVLAGPLLRRFGLSLGIAANPVVLTLFAGAMVAANAVTGGTSLALLWVVSAGRIADIALTDGTTRTSINAVYQVLPERARLSVQTAVEGIGVPVAIGISGVLILALNALPSALTATIVVTTLVCVVWVWVGLLLYRAYGPALVQALHRRPVLVPADDLGATVADEAVAIELLSAADLRTSRLGMDLLTAMSSPGVAGELTRLGRDPRPEVRMPALTGLAASGDAMARRLLAEEVRACAASPSPDVRIHAARALEVLDSGDRAAFAPLLEDDDPRVRSAALESVQAGDVFAVAPTVAALEDPRSAGAAAGAAGRLGDDVVPTMAELLEAGAPAQPLAMRLVRAAAIKTPARDAVLLRHVQHPDRELALLVTERLVAPEAAEEATAAALDTVLVDDLRHAALILGALVAIERGNPAGAPELRETDEPLRRALRDELDLMGRKVGADLLARHGSLRLGPVMVELGAGGPLGEGLASGRSNAALALEALSVLLGSERSGPVLALFQPDVSISERLRRLPEEPRGDRRNDLAGWLGDLVEDPRDEWRSTWLRACAIHAASARGLLRRMDLGSARALADPIVDEALARPLSAGS